MATCVHAEKLQKQCRFVVSLAKQIDYKNMVLFDLERELEEKDVLLNEALKEMQSFKEKLGKLRFEMEYQREQFEQQAKELDCLRALVQTQCSKPEIERMKNVVESRRTDSEHQLVKKFKKLDEKDDFKQNHTKDDREESKENLEDLENENADMKAEIQTLILKERMSNDELQEARKEAIRVLQGMLNRRTTFVIKRMGQVDRKPFQAMCAQKSSAGNWEEESAKLCSLWEENVKNPHWHPFKRVKTHGKLVEIVDEDDEKLKGLRDEGGEDVYKAVVDALMELNEYNPSGRYPVPELWNLKEKRRASLKEIIEYITKQLKTLKRKRQRL